MKSDVDSAARKARQERNEARNRYLKTAFAAAVGAVVSVGAVVGSTFAPTAESGLLVALMGIVTAAQTMRVAFDAKTEKEIYRRIDEAYKRDLEQGYIPS